MSVRVRLPLLLAALALSPAGSALGAVAVPVIEDMNNAGAVVFGGGVNVYNFGASTSFNDQAVASGNDLLVYTFDGISGGDGMGFSVSISNGENGLNSSEGGSNTDIPNATPADPVFATIGNASGKLENDNYIRASVWMRQDPNSPMVKAPQIEPVFKFELWKEALSAKQNTTAGAYPADGDRIWDTDQNASAAEYAGAQSRGSWVDMNNDGVTSFGNPVAVSLVTDEWRLVTTTIRIDDNPLINFGLNGWTVGGIDFFSVADVEEIRTSMFLGDYASSNLTDAGSIWVDNLMVEVFKDEASMLATAIANPEPTDPLAGDYNNDGKVDAADYTVWRDGGAPGGATQDGYTAWANNYGATIGASNAVSVPEPTAFTLALLAAAAVGGRRAA